MFCVSSKRITNKLELLRRRNLKATVAPRFSNKMLVLSDFILFDAFGWPHITHRCFSNVILMTPQYRFLRLDVVEPLETV